MKLGLTKCLFFHISQTWAKIYLSFWQLSTSSRAYLEPSILREKINIEEKTAIFFFRTFEHESAKRKLLFFSKTFKPIRNGISYFSMLCMVSWNLEFSNWFFFSSYFFIFVLLLLKDSDNFFCQFFSYCQPLFNFCMLIQIYDKLENHREFKMFCGEKKT